MFQSVNTSPIPSIQEVWDEYRLDLQKVETHIQKNLSSEVPLINEVAQYILNSGGKRIRPLLVIISSKLCPSPGDRHIILGSAMEFIHTATLLHDDVIDEGTLRRGKKTARTIWGNHVSILVGDYLYATAGANALSLKNHEVNIAVQDACSRMIEGEMAQHTHNGDLGMMESDYIRIIEQKTASFIATCARLGGIASEASPEQIQALNLFGLNLGIAFQVADDTLDYAAQKNRLGKTLGADLREGKITLPLIHLLRTCSEDEKGLVARTFGLNGSFETQFDQVLGLMYRHGSIQYASSVARKYVEMAKGYLSVFEPSIHKTALHAVADYVVSRDH